MLDFLGLERAGEGRGDRTLAVGEPFLEDMIATELAGPDIGGDVAPAGASVQVDVEVGFATHPVGHQVVSSLPA